MPRYRVDVADAHAHLFRVTLTLSRPAPAQRFSLPVWAPGSYMVRDFVRHLSGLRAVQRGEPVPLEQVDKTSWVAHAGDRSALTLSYLVYAFDASVRGAFLGSERGFFNGSSVLLRAEGREAEPHTLQIGKLPPGWGLATAMPAASARHRFVAADYDELVDHPFELGPVQRLQRLGFKAGGVRFEVVVTGAWPSFSADRLADDMRRVCAETIAFWHPRGAAPFARYLFLLHAGGSGCGGLEHRISSALVCARRDLPRTGESARSEGYVALLGLVAHELFHAWSVKRLRPREWASPDYNRENHTSLLWFFEGFTTYFEDRLLLRAGLVDAAQYLRLLARTITALAASPGRQVQSVAAASFDAWTRYYRSDENTPNSTVSYYTKGALVALAFDLTLRADGQGSLDEVLRLLWQRCRRRGLTEPDIEQALVQVAGRSLRAELQAWVHGTDELPLQPLLEAAGVRWQQSPAALAQAVGLRLSEGAVSGVHVRSVLRGSAAERAGLAAGDELLAVDGWRIRRLEDARQWLAPGVAFELLFVRDERVRNCRVDPACDMMPTITLALSDAPGAAAVLRQGWLGA
ncbi:MAG TPA: PDZ domain-containing protein [Rubrivivax sp.]